MKKQASAALAAICILSAAAVPASAALTKGDFTANIYTVTGNPITEAGAQFNPKYEVTPGQTIYFMLPDSLADWAVSDNVRVRPHITKNSAFVKSIEVVERRVTDEPEKFYIPAVKDPTSKDYIVRNTDDRHAYIAVKLNDANALNEYKIEFDVDFTVAKQPVKLYYGDRTGGDAIVTNTIRDPFSNTYRRETKQYQYFEGVKGDRLTLEGYLFIANKAKSGQPKITVGTEGVVFSPVPRQENRISFKAGEILANITFTPDGTTKKFLARLSTAMPEEQLARFSQTDAVYRGFGDVIIDSPTRPVLSLTNPFPPSAKGSGLYIYQVFPDQTLQEVTSQFNIGQHYAPTLKTNTRILGNYILSNVAVPTR